MKKVCLTLIVMALVFSACTKEASVKKTYEGNLYTYYEMSDGRWKCGEHLYKYRLEIKGRMAGTAKDTTFVYLSNMKDISFDQAWKAGGLSSDLNDYFDPKDALLVEMD